MNSTLKVQDVRLPKDFKVETRPEKGGVAFRFAPALELPFCARELVEAYSKKENAGTACCQQHGYGLTVPDFHRGAFALLKKALPVYLGHNGFFDVNLGNEDYTISDETETIYAAHRDESGRLLSSLVLSLHSQQSFQVIGQQMPAIDSGFVRGHVMIPAHIPSNKESHHYNFDIAGPILAALLLDNGIEIRGEERMRKGSNFSMPLLHIKVADPTFERVSDAVKLARLIGAFFQDNGAGLQGVAELVVPAWRHEESKGKLRVAHEHLQNACDRVREKISHSLPQPRDLGHIFSHIDKEVGRILGPANDRLAPLRASFPQEARRILGYATTERAEGNRENSFYC